MKQNLNIVIAGVGGQGTLFASRVLGQLAKLMALDVKVSEVHGMSQRGGSVVTYVRMGEKVYSPLIDAGSADYVLAFEELEAMRYLPALKEDGIMIVNSQQIMPMPVLIGAAQYPTDIPHTIAQRANTVLLDAQTLAKQAGSERAVNTVLLGVLAARLDVDKSLFVEALTACVPERFMQANMAAFELGYHTAK